MRIPSDTSVLQILSLPPVVVIATAAGLIGCERKTESANKPPEVATEVSLIDFPPEVQADDPAVNQFAREIIETCAGGDYERFRLLWTVKEDPFPRRQFERGWKALKKVRVLALQKMKTPQGEYLYYIHARVELDESMPEPTREVVLLMIKENDRWRLASAPAHLRKKVLGDAADGDADTNASHGPSEASEPRCKGEPAAP